MKLVAAARLRRAQDAIVAARPYATAAAPRCSATSRRACRLEAPGRRERIRCCTSAQIKVARLIIVTADRGLAGGFNSNLARRVERFLVDEKEQYPQVELAVVGRKGARALEAALGPARRTRTPRSSPSTRRPPPTRASIGRASWPSRRPQDYLDGKIDAVLVAYNEFKSAISQVVQIEQLLPIEPAKTARRRHALRLRVRAVQGATCSRRWCRCTSRSRSSA